MVFNIQPLADENHQTLAAVVNKAGDKGASIQFDTRQLPVLTLWKNTDTVKQGYVTGIEPGTSYAYPVTIEREQKRVKQLQPGASAQFDLTYTLLHDSARWPPSSRKSRRFRATIKWRRTTRRSPKSKNTPAERPERYAAPGYARPITSRPRSRANC